MTPTIEALLAAAVADIGGTERPGQTQMAQAVAAATISGEHLLVQAGTGTGKSLAYLVPAIAHAFDSGKPAVVATATLALQSQIVRRDLPRLAEALTPLLGRTPTFAMVKGRRNYVCRYKLDGGFPTEDEALFEVEGAQTEVSDLGAEVLRVRAWAASTETGERDDLIPGVSERAWRQVSVNANECLASRCPMVTDCFVETARAQAREADVVVTNHAFMAIDAFEGRVLLPEHDLLIIDEGHELVDRVTSSVTDDLTAGSVRAAAKRVGRSAEAGQALQDAADVLEGALDPLEPGRLSGLPDALVTALTLVRDAARAALSELKPDEDGALDPGRSVARAAVEEIRECAVRVLEERPLDVAWVTGDARRSPVLRIAPMSVATAIRDSVFAHRVVVLTSATLELGGSFDAVARTIGLSGAEAPAWTGLDVGSPFDYPRQAMAYVAAALPPPGRDGPSSGAHDELADLMIAAGGRTLGLFSSMRAARVAADELRGRLAEHDIDILLQGDDQLATLVAQFAAEARTALFGTMSLWQGVDVPGSACQLVVIDRIPFPRPDDPISSARTEEIARRGGNGFMAVSATHAALRLAQGAGRLIRRSDDRGVVAFLDSRMVTARYAGFLQSSLPPFWPTTDRELVLGALARLDAEAPPPRPVRPPGEVGASMAVPEVPELPVAPDPPPPAAARTAVVHAQGWTISDDDDLRDGLELGLSVAELAESLERSVPTIEARMAALGLEASSAD